MQTGIDAGLAPGRVVAAGLIECIAAGLAVGLVTSLTLITLVVVLGALAA